jgi:hypothetical protein
MFTLRRGILSIGIRELRPIALTDCLKEALATDSLLIGFNR